MTDPPPDRLPRSYELPRGRLGRSLPVASLTLRTAGAAASAALRRKQPDAAASGMHRRAAERYAELLGRSRGALMKAGQLLSLVALGPAVPAEHQAAYQEALARLQDDAPPMPPELAAAVAEQELRCPLDQVFADFSPHPIAAASIGQVHAARLPDGRRAAVKIQYPGVAQAIRADLRNSQLLVTFLQLGRGLTSVRADMNALAREVAARIEEELDYRSEAAYQAEFAAAYRGHPFIRIPEIIPELSASRILTMDLADGRRWPQAITAAPALRNRWGEVIYRFAIGSLTRLRMVNADPQPGNYLFHEDGAVTFLDFGCVRQYTGRQITALQAAAQAVVDGDEQALSQVLGAAGYLDPADPPDPGQLLRWLREALTPVVAPQPFTFTPGLAAQLVRAGLSRSGGHAEVTRRLTVPASFVSIARVNLGLTAVLGALRATGEWDAIRREHDHAGPAATPLGILDLGFWQARRAERAQRP
jgi:predicted unusual protein kinase regulating ubiquinone biosynthesis (AarF/ABC1/UbiB family)